MASLSAESESQVRLAPWELALGPIAAVVVAAALIAPRATPGLLAALLAVLLLCLPRPGGGRSMAMPALGPLAIIAGALGLYLALNATWSASRSEAFGKAAFYGYVLAAVSLAAGAAASMGKGAAEEVRLSRLAQGIILGFAAGLSFLVIEAVAAHPVKRVVYSILHWARPDPKHIVTAADGSVQAIGHYVLNRGLAVMNLALWPVLALVVLQVRNSGLRTAVMGLLFALAAVGVAFSEHETSMLALAGALITFAGMRLVGRAFRWAVLVGWIGAVLLVVPLALSAHSAGLHQASWLPQTGRNRIILWNVTATETLKRPILGVGVAATKELDEARIELAKPAPGNAYPERTGRHAHNIYLQTWYELGAVGAAGLLALGLAILGWLWRLPEGVQPYAFAGFVSAAVIGAFSWGLWQVWFLGAYAMAALLTVFATALWHRLDGPR